MKLLAAILGAALLACNGAEPRIRLNETAGTIEVHGLPSSRLEELREKQLSTPEWNALLAIHSGPLTEPAMLGAYEVTADAIVFRPRFPLVRGLPYRVRFDRVETIVTLPKRPVRADTVVAQIYPTTNELPANQLKFYLSFSKPMSTGDAYSHIRLVDEQGHDVPRAFLQTAQELWDAERRRFTLILDPGRIKRGLRANLESGAPLREGRTYKLVISEQWRDGDGNPLRAPFEKTFRVIATDATMPDPHAWRVTAPRADSIDALRIDLDEPLDRPLLEEMLVVTDARGHQIAGNVEIANGEQQWTFHPRAPWRRGAYAIHVNAKLEDRAGNNLHRLFDAAVSAVRNEARAVELAFEVD